MPARQRHRAPFRPVISVMISAVVVAVLASSAALSATPAGATTTGPKTATMTAQAVHTPATVTGNALPTWQIDGVVWDTATVGDTVYAVGRFDHARPPGTTRTSKLRVVRHNILAFDITTGVVTGFTHSLNGAGLRISASPDGKTIYVGGKFTKVDGQVRTRLAAFDVKTGDLVRDFHPRVDNYVRALAATNGGVYVGGDFTVANATKRTHLAAFTRAGGLKAWKPRVSQGTVFALAVLPGGERVAVGGSFQKLNGKARVGIGAVAAGSGATRVWKSTPVPARVGPRDSYVSDLIVSGSVVYATNVGNGGHWFDGRWAAKASNGRLVWLDNCYGATLSGYVSGKVFYSVGHAHDCSALGAFTEQHPKRHYQALAETTYATRTDRTAPSKNSTYRHTRTPSLLHWYPTLGPGHFTGRHQAAWAITGNGTYVALAGEFVTVNGVRQQGLTRFAIRAKDRAGSAPKYSAGTRPRPVAAAAGRAKVTWTRTWDREDARLTYTVLRRVASKTGTQTWTTVAKVRASSQPWRLRKLSVTDKGLVKGRSYEYRVVSADPAGNSWPSHPSNVVKGR